MFYSPTAGFIIVQTYNESVFCIPYRAIVYPRLSVIFFNKGNCNLPHKLFQKKIKVKEPENKEHQKEYHWIHRKSKEMVSSYSGNCHYHVLKSVSMKYIICVTVE